MTTLILDWSDWDGPASGWVSLTRVTWRRDPDTYQVPWTRQVRVDGRATVDVQGMAGEVLRVRWTPDGGGSRTEHVRVPAEGEHLAHLLERVDPSTLEPLPEDMPSATELVARAESLVTRIESGEFTGADGSDGRGVESITDEDTDGVATVTLSDGSTSSLPLPRGLEGAPGRDGVDGAPGADGRDGQDGRTPDLTWQGTALAVDGVPGPDLRGPAGEDGADGVNGEDGAPGPAPSIKIGTVTSGATPSATITGTSPDLTLGLVLPKGDPGQPGTQGPPGVVSSASSYVIVGPGRPDTPSTTAGAVTGSEPVGAEYRSTDGAGVGAWTWTKRPGGRWHVTNGDSGWRDVTAQTWVHETSTYATPGGSHVGTVIRLTTTGMDLIVRGSGGSTNPGVAIATNQHLRIPILRSLLPAQFTWNSYSSLPHGLREYFGDISIQWGRAPAAVWFLPRDPAAWPTTLPGSPA